MNTTTLGSLIALSLFAIAGWATSPYPAPTETNPSSGIQATSLFQKNSSIEASSACSGNTATVLDARRLTGVQHYLAAGFLEFPSSTESQSDAQKAMDCPTQCGIETGCTGHYGEFYCGSTYCDGAWWPCKEEMPMEPPPEEEN